MLFSATERATMSLFNLATITFLKEKRGSYGSYYVWGTHQWQYIPALLRRSAGCAFHSQYLTRYRRWLPHCICLGPGYSHVVFLRATMVQVRVP